MAGGIAHDFNNILQSQLLHSEIIARHLSKDSKIAKNLNQIIEGGKRARDLVKGILAFSRAGEAKYYPVKFQDVLEDTLGLISGLLPANIEVQTTIDTGVTPVLGDKTQLQQVILNLCNNAHHAIGAHGGLIKISLKEIHTSEAKKASQVELVVSDTGCGMNETTLDRIFDPFFTTKEVGEGTGLGLSVIHGIILDMQGEIKVKSEEGEGSEFRVRLPATHEKPTKALQVKASESTSLKGSVLLVDDEPDILLAGKQTLENLGLEVITEPNGEAALKRFSHEHTNLAIVIIDLMMPKMTGLEFSRQALKISPSMPIIIMSGRFSAGSKQDCEKMGLLRLHKPWSERDIIHIFNTLISKEST